MSLLTGKPQPPLWGIFSSILDPHITLNIKRKVKLHAFYKFMFDNFITKQIMAIICLKWQQKQIYFSLHECALKHISMIAAIVWSPSYEHVTHKQSLLTDNYTCTVLCVSVCTQRMYHYLPELASSQWLLKMYQYSL